MPSTAPETSQQGPKFGITTVCGLRKDMEDEIAIHPSFSNFSDYFGVFDGHGCSHVASRCKDRMHEIVKNEVENGADSSWEHIMRKSFLKMDQDNTEWSSSAAAKCRCEMVSPECKFVGSTAVVAVVSPHQIVVSNCGGSRALLCRKGVLIRFSSLTMKLNIRALGKCDICKRLEYQRFREELNTISLGKS